MKVAAALLRILKSAGVRHLFGNPGTTELTFLDALAGSGLEYIVGLQEATAVAAADGYAQASGSPGVVNVHVGPGVANGLSILHSAARARSPLVMTAGQQDTRFLMHEPILAADLVQMTEQFTKWSYEIRRADEATNALRRALTLALTPPTGPVFLSLPMDLMVEEVDDAGDGPTRVQSRTTPDADGLTRAVDLLSRARTPALVAGDGVGRSGAVEDLVALAELLGARVHGEPLFRRTNFPGDHPLWRGGLYPAPSGVRKSLDGADVVLIVGATVFTWFLHSPGEPFAPGQAVIQIDDDGAAIGRSYGVTLGLLADPRSALQALCAALAPRLVEAARAAAVARLEDARRTRREYTTKLAAGAAADAGRVPIAQTFLFETLASLAPDNAIIVDESASSLPFVLRHMRFKTPGSFFGSKTGTLGWAMGAAIGIQLASPGRKVIATVGDGSVMYAPQALWTAARHGLPITYVVPNNASYAILKSGMLSLGLPSAKRGDFPGMDLVDPEIDYVSLARSMGVHGERVEKPDAVRRVLEAALAHAGPAVVDVAIDRGVTAMA